MLDRNEEAYLLLLSSSEIWTELICKLEKDIYIENNKDNKGKQVRDIKARR